MKPGDLFILGIIVGGFLLYNIFKILRKKRLRKRMNRARKAEGRALKFLNASGYEILDVQKRVPFVTFVDGKPYKNSIQADYVVTKDGLRYVVEVKTGEEATQVTNTQTRRQLLEYYLIYRPDGILLLDMESQVIREVNFQVDLPLWSKGPSLMIYLVIFALGGLMVFILLEGGFLR